MSKNKLEILLALDSFAQSEGLSLQRSDDHSELLKAIENKFKSFEKPGIEVFGLRTQLMFAYVVNSLHTRIAITEEDAGLFFSEHEDICRPDFRIKTPDKEFFVEVKNLYEKNFNTPFQITSGYLEKLGRYAEMFGLPLFIAVYWARMKIWTMLPADVFSGNVENFKISLTEAIVQNHMHLVGDAMLGLIPSIGLRLYFDQDRTTEIDADGKSNVVIKAAKLFSGNVEIEDKNAGNLLWHILQYGDWTEFDNPAEIRGNKLVSVDFVVSPLERANPDEEFEIIGALSSVLSRQFGDLTTDENGLVSVTPSRALYDLGGAVKEVMKIGDLKVWKFVVHPSARP